MTQFNENLITTINYEYKNGRWRVWVSYEPLGGIKKEDDRST